MQTTALVAFGDMGESVSGFEDKIFKQGGRHNAVSVLLKNRRIVPELTVFSIN
ncbi:hypothetical protein ES15_0790 [Cronobacter sakazakii ES15]|nr:hypothetical protein ES15_0790 [Cronobacter sakazakii ES15]